ncbi:MAG: sigma-70 family RNA polymerase sigma factor [Opitutaceae bacterium]
MSAAQESLFKVWLQEHRGIFVKVARSYAQGEAEAADLQQEMFYQLWLSLPRFGGHAKPSTWIYRVCLNTALAWRRGAQRREVKMEPGVDLAQLSAGTASPAETVGEQELMGELFAAIHAMPATERALVLLLLDGMSYREIAEVTGLTENHVGVALTRARKRLASLMKGVIDEL